MQSHMYIKRHMLLFQLFVMLQLAMMHALSQMHSMTHVAVVQRRMPSALRTVDSSVAARRDMSNRMQIPVVGMMRALYMKNRNKYGKWYYSIVDLTVFYSKTNQFKCSNIFIMLKCLQDKWGDHFATNHDSK